MKKVRYNKRMKAHKKLILVAALIIVGGVGTGVALALQPDKEETGAKTSLVNSVGNPQNEPVEAVTEQETTTEPVEQEEQPVEVVNPYRVASNIYYAFEARSKAGLTTPEGRTEDTTYALDVLNGTIPSTTTPSLHAIVVIKRDSYHSMVLGFVESIDEDTAVISSRFGTKYTIDLATFDSTNTNYRFIP